MFVDAASYERFMGRWSAVLAPGFLDAVDLGDGHGVVVDVGCGTGNLASAVLDRWPDASVVGVDPSEAFVESARRRFGDSGFRGEVGYAAALPLPDAAADATLALLVLNFLPDPAAGVADMRRVTRPGGVVGATVWDYGGGMAMLRTYWDAAAAVRPDAAAVDEALASPARAGGIEALFAGAGLTDVRGGLLEVGMRFETFDDYWRPFLLGIGPAGDFTRALDDAGREALRAELLRRLGDGPVEMTSTARWVRGLVPA
ncbi:methyltransferase domain-containing protein [Oryzobacter sp. R7]|uniref:methyltransferase domain-containing protein n=1 Tax=Oryzobacter faecalis TaxID=3388656 RepID=UPI00398CF4E1